MYLDLTNKINFTKLKEPANIIKNGGIALKLIEYAGIPIATPSANISGKPSGTNMKNIIKDFNGKVDYLIDSGTSQIGLASTIVQVNVRLALLSLLYYNFFVSL